MVDRTLLMYKGIHLPDGEVVSATETSGVRGDDGITPMYRFFGIPPGCSIGVKVENQPVSCEKGCHIIVWWQDEQDCFHCGNKHSGRYVIISAPLPIAMPFAFSAEV